LTLQLCVRSSSHTSTFEYHGEAPELWLQSVKRVVMNPKFEQEPKSKSFLRDPANVVLPEWQATITSQGMRAVKDRVRLPAFYIEVEHILTQIRNGGWHSIEKDFDRAFFKHGIRKVWIYASEDGMLVLERLVYEALMEQGNGGLTVEDILVRLWRKDTRASFHEVRDALEHLCILYVVERQHGMFAPRFGILE